MVQWIPSTCKGSEKMSYAMFSNTVKSSLTGIHCVVQACNKSDLDKEVVLQRVSRYERDQL